MGELSRGGGVKSRLNGVDGGGGGSALWRRSMDAPTDVGGYARSGVDGMKTEL
jgi:hypothetical protein